jgi:hypothetical protein
MAVTEECISNLHCYEIRAARRRREPNPRRAERAKFYEAVALTGTYDPAGNYLTVASKPAGDMVRVGRGT